MLGQSRPPDEVLVVDDGSRDSSAGVARAFGAAVRVLSQPPLGTSAAVNRGVENARGRLLAFLDADDLWPAEKLELQLTALGLRPDVEAVFGHAVEFGKGRPVVEPVPGYVRGTLLIRREAYDRVGPFADFPFGEFFEWYARAVDAGLRTLLLPDVLLRRRIHETNLGIRRRGEREEYARALKAVLDRRRGTSRR